MAAYTMTCVLDMTSTLSVVTWQKNIKPQRSSVWGTHTPRTDTYEQAAKPTEDISKLEVLMKIKSMQSTTHLREGEKLRLWVVDLAGAREVCLRLAAGGEYSLEGEELLPEWSAGLGERFCLWELSEGSLGNKQQLV